MRGLLFGIAMLVVGLDVEALETADRVDGRAAAAVGWWIGGVGEGAAALTYAAFTPF